MTNAVSRLTAADYAEGRVGMSDLRPVNISQLYDAVRAIYDHPSASDVHYGCDCGCGGDSYTDEMWRDCDREEKDGIAFLATLGLKPADAA